MSALAIRLHAGLFWVACGLFACSCSGLFAAENNREIKKIWALVGSADSMGDSKEIAVALGSENTQPVGLTGGEVRATLVAYKPKVRGQRKAQGFIEFSSNVLVNSYSRKGCHGSTCFMEARFDSQAAEKFKLFEDGSGAYLKRVLVYDSQFFEKAFKARTITIKLKFADADEGVFAFRNSANFSWNP